MSNSVSEARVLCGDWRGAYDGGWQGLITPESNLTIYMVREVKYNQA
jgi:hypothetical protein